MMSCLARSVSSSEICFASSRFCKSFISRSMMLPMFSRLSGL
ncbi:hypothetical protein EVA_17189 [gut metagenome]|uniref:Uncharacterized protein n=1 Tax=gut metagenome TaxID=749906 RepID=J9G5B7_9ZZZZ